MRNKPGEAWPMSNPLDRGSLLARVCVGVLMGVCVCVCVCVCGWQPSANRTSALLTARRRSARERACHIRACDPYTEPPPPRRQQKLVRRHFGYMSRGKHLHSTRPEHRDEQKDWTEGGRRDSVGTVGTTRDTKKAGCLKAGINPRKAPIIH